MAVSKRSLNARAGAGRAYRRRLVVCGGVVLHGFAATRVQGQEQATREGVVESGVVMHAGT